MSDTSDSGKLPQRQLLDVLISAGLVAFLVFLCYKILSPFLTMLLWSVVLAVTLYPVHQLLAKWLGGRQGRAAVMLVMLGLLLIGIPVVLVSVSLAETAASMAKSADASMLVIPSPPASIADWPLIGGKLHSLWSTAATNLPALIKQLLPGIGNVMVSVLGVFTDTVTGLIAFLAAFFIAGAITAHGQQSAHAARRISRRFMGPERGDHFAALSVSTIRAVANGVLGVAFIQSMLMGLVLMAAGVPFAGAIAGIAFVFGVVQLPNILIALPVIGYIWLGGDYSTVSAVINTVLLMVCGTVDNVLKPLLLGRGVDAPMPVILLGALGGMVAGGMLGMFLGAVMLALGYQMFMGWVNMQEPIKSPNEKGAV